MTPFASVALYVRRGSVVFKPPRKEREVVATQARKAAARYWRAKTTLGDRLAKVILVREVSGHIEISERAANTTSDNPWRTYMTSGASVSEAHIAACLSELGIDHLRAQPTMPDVLEINGVIYRRDV